MNTREMTKACKVGRGVASLLASVLLAAGPAFAAPGKVVC